MAPGFGGFDVVGAAASIRHGHLPMPFSLSGNGITNVVRGLVTAHVARGGDAAVVMTKGRSGEVLGAQNLYVDYSPACPREYFTRHEYLIDFASGLLAQRRPHVSGMFDLAASAIADAEPGLIFVHEGHYAATALPVFREAFPSATLVYYVHSPISRSYSTRELRRLLSYADHVVGVSAHIAQHVSERTRGKHPPVSAIINGVDSAFFVPSSKARQREPLRLLFVGQVAPHKGVHLIFDAIRLLHLQEQERLTVRIVGSSVHGHVTELTAYERSLREAAAKLRTDAEFVPFQDNNRLRDHYAWADVALVPSVFDEPCGLVVLEAMAAGLCVLASNAGGMPEVLGGCGLLAERNPDSIATLLRELLRDEALCMRTGRLARARATELTWESRLQSLERNMGLA